MNLEICAVVVTYHPDNGFEKRFAQIIKQISKLVVVDNGSSPEVIAQLKTLTTQEPHRVSLIENRENLGVATAFNQGVNWALNQNVQFVLLLDQDSELMDHFASSLSKAYEKYEPKSRLGVLGANYLDLTSTSKPLPQGDTLWVKRPTVISAGSLIPLTAWKQIGPLRDDLFIDHVDDEFCLRARSLGFDVVRTATPLFFHQIGNAVTKKCLWRTVTPMNQSAFRWYHVARNSKYLTKKYLFNEPRWVLEIINGLSRRLVKMLLYEEKRGEKLRAIFRGLRDEKNLK